MATAPAPAPAPASTACTGCSGAAAPPTPGRFAVVDGGDRSFLFLPELYRLFDIPDAVREALSDFGAGTVSDNLPGLRPGEAGVRAAMRAVIAAHADTAAPLPPADPDPVPDLKDLVLNVSQLCNLACAYCYAEDLNSAGTRMRPDTADTILDAAMALSRSGIGSIKFLGGEPTLAFETIRHVVAAVERRWPAAGWPLPVFVVVTNGTAVTDAMIAFFREHDFYVLVSLDGPPAVHDTLRPFAGGRGSYHRASETVRRLRAAGVDGAVEAVYTRTHAQAGLSVRDLADHIRSLGVTEMQITLALGTWHGEDCRAELEAVTESFVAVARACVRSLRTADPFLLRGIHFVLDGLVKRERRGHVCGAGRTFMAVNADGTAYPCYLLQSAETRYGVLGGDWSQDRYAAVSDRFRANGKSHHAPCRECWANEICQSCLGSSFLLDQRIDKPPAWFCAVQKTLIAAVLGEVADALRSDDRAVFLRALAQVLKPRSPTRAGAARTAAE
ncbi:radical SAM/SPASM domain-containing protein [Roseospira goensis]|uniref:Radical SAM core domain-containing protein n=1 Tax=Roseospira goensis TaxID=391922 RepID=A0A7W6RW71_9PROT|nr:radical SAM protein [Roseospira goensis]MBB4284345.1 uncharacterized protein [Roseospira goensis]